MSAETASLREVPLRAWLEALELLEELRDLPRNRPCKLCGAAAGCSHEAECLVERAAKLAASLDKQPAIGPPTETPADEVGDVVPVLPSAFVPFWTGGIALSLQLTHTPPPGKLVFSHAAFTVKWEHEGEAGRTFVPLASVDLIVEVRGHQFRLQGRDVTAAVLSILDQAEAAAATFEALAKKPEGGGAS